MQKWIHGGGREWFFIILSLLLFLFALIFPMQLALAEKWTPEEQQLLEAYRSGQLIRLHVIANSDSAADQAIKLHVRDALIAAFGDMLSNTEHQSADSLYKSLEQSVHLMQTTAQSCAAAHGFEEGVTAEVGYLNLPEKQYGNVVLPAGDYRALRIVLGEGKGQNWWCVLYPQLCLALTSTDQESENKVIYWTSKHIFENWLLVGQ